MDIEQFRQLLDHYLLDTLSEEERVQFRDLLDSPEYREELGRILAADWTAQDDGADPDPRIADRVYLRLVEARDRRSATRRLWRITRWAAAAVLLVAAGLGIFYGLRPHSAPPVAVAPSLPHDVAPGHSGAILTLSGGRQIVLDSTANGTVATQGSATAILKNNSGISYTAATRETAMVYNTLSTPRGRVYQLTLPDGTRVWLNAASSIRYPTAFNGNERRIEVTGEAYFEVAPNPARPFRVSIPAAASTGGRGEEIEVLGTSFDINAYPDEPASTTTLIEGAVRVTPAAAAGPAQRLSPGQEARVTAGHITVRAADTSEVTAWKKGYFHFETADLPTILRQFSRWYDVDIVYRNGIPTDRFFSIMRRNSPLSAVLKALQAEGVHFTIEGKALIVQRE